MEKRKFNFTEGELYALCLTGWETCSRNLQALTAFSPVYSEAYVAERKNEVLETMSKFNRQQRRAELRKLRTDLNTELGLALSGWRSLKHYVEVAFAGEKLDAVMIEAGLQHYAAARNKRWEEVLKLLKAGQSLIRRYKTELSANQNMPEAFPLEFDELLTRYSDRYDAYLTAGVESRERTGQHTGLLNKLYDDLNRMFAAGREVFKQNTVLADQFRLSSNLSVITGTGWAGIKGRIFDENGKQRLIVGLEISLPETEDVVSQEADGSFTLNHLPAGSYTLTVKAPGYQLWQQEVDIKLDTYSSFEVRLLKAPDPPLTESTTETE